MPQKGAREEEGQHPMNLELAGKVAIVTGGDSGIGAAVCRMLAEEGVKVVIADRQDEKGTAAARAIQQRGGSAMFVRTDVSRRVEVNALIATTLQAYRQVDILCNIAGPGAQGGQLETTEAELDRQLNGHLKGVFHCTQEVLPHMMQRRSGKIINMGSLTAYGATADIPAYCAAFGGILAYSKSVARFAAAYNINVNTVSPGTIATPMTAAWLSQPGVKEAVLRQIPIGRVGEPEDVAAVYVFLASDRARHLVGTDIIVSGGQVLC